MFNWRIKIIKKEPKIPFLDKIKDALEQGGYEAAKEVCRYTKGKQAAFAYQLLTFLQER